MTAWLAEQLATYFALPQENTEAVLRRLLVGLAAAGFVLLATLIIAFDNIFPGFNSIASLAVGDVAPRAITAPDASFISQLLTEEARAAASAAVPPVYDPPDPNVARQQTGLAQQIILFIQNVRRDIYGTPEQKIHDLNQITALALDENVALSILQMDEDTWTAVQDEIINVLPRVMREAIRPADMQSFRYQLPTQVSVRFNPQERDVIVAIIEDLLRPNTFENPEATAAARAAAAEAVAPVSRRFVRGENVIDAGRQITPADYEALQALGLLRPDDVRLQEIGRAGLASLLVMVIMGLFIARFEPGLIESETRLLALLAIIFLVMLAAIRFFGSGTSLYLFPTAAMALVFVVIVSPHLTIMSSLGLALLAGLMMNNSLETATLIGAGSIIGALALRRAERLNSFFVAGLLIGLINLTVVSIFTLSAPLNAGDPETPARLLLSLLSGMLIVPASAIAAMYLITTLFNLTTALKLLDLSQPNKPLLQRLLREAPGTYQHSLQVANLAEQAASAIGADAGLTHVAALYHDIGKMLNPLYFTENQQDVGNPHDTLNDPYRSADIILSHVSEGDELARQYRLPQRIRDFIREHHGTTRVYVFYQRALNLVEGDASAVDVKDFTYPGPRPRSKETAILMLADSCEAAVRAAKLQSKLDIASIVSSIIDQKMKDGQLDKSGLTLNDLRAIQTTFVDVLQGTFHPRLNYQEAVGRKDPPATSVETVLPPRATDHRPAIVVTPGMERIPELASTAPRPELRPAVTESGITIIRRPAAAASDDEPVTDVPRLPRPDEKRLTGLQPTLPPRNGKATPPPENAPQNPGKPHVHD
ncbi:MAG: HDIG domain-containing protein [Anaerolineae bacterium]|jgi:hypothetical protein|nr:HDIG domain-containing protein [Anaerolineae bacterium]